MYQNASDLIDHIKSAHATLRTIPAHKPSPLPTDDVIIEFLETAFHATLTTEEGRRVGFRAILMPEPTKGKSKKLDRFENMTRYITFDNTRPFTVSEVNKIAPAADFTRLLLCVSSKRGKSTPLTLYMWGLLDVGKNWWNFIHHESSSRMPPPNFLTVSSMRPGELTISFQGDVLMTLQNGTIHFPSTSPIWDGPVSDFLEPARQRLYLNALESLKSKTWSDSGSDEDYPKRFYNFFIERVLFHVREMSHGGTIIIVPSYMDKDDTRLSDRINIKYGTTYNYAWDFLCKSLEVFRSYYDLHFPLWDGKNLTKENFQTYSMLDGEREEIDEAISDAAKTIASLSAVDGAVVITDDFRVLGFGAEVIATSNSLISVSAIGRDGNTSPLSIETFGTRHRSAFRFCSSLEDAVAFIVSQDGGVKAVKRVGKQVILWPDINNGSMGI